MASPTAESANAALWTCSSCFASSISPSHSSSAMKGIFSLKAGDGVAQVQCAPWPPTLVAAAAAGKLEAWAEPAPPKSRRWVPWRAVNIPSVTVAAGMPSDSR